MPSTSYSSTIATSTGTVELGVRDTKSGTIVAVSGTHSGFTVVFEGTRDGSVWFKLPTVRLASGFLEVRSAALPDNYTGAWYVANGLFTKVRVRATARTSGTLAVTLTNGDMKTLATAGHRALLENTGKKTVYFAAGSGAANSVLVSSGPGILHGIIVNTAGATAGMIIYDNATTNSGTIVYKSADTHAIGAYAIGMPFVNGLTLRKASTTAEGIAIYSLV